MQARAIVRSNHYLHACCNAHIYTYFHPYPYPFSDIHAHSHINSNANPNAFRCIRWADL